MHEYSIVRALLDRVDEVARQHDANAVHLVRVQIGEVSGVEAELLREAFSIARTGSLSAEADLEIVPVPARWSCPVCSLELARGQPLSCPECDSPVRLIAGGEILLQTVEMEVP